MNFQVSHPPLASQIQNPTGDFTQTTATMDILPWHFRTFQIFGLYHEDNRSLWPLKFLHKLIALSLTFHFALLQFVNLLTMRDFDIEIFTACLFLTLTYIAASFKQINFVLDRAKIDRLINKFRRRICRAENTTETEILAKYGYLAKRVFVVRMITTGASGAAFLITALIDIDSENLQLPFNSYQSFDVSNVVSYVIAYAVQLMTTVATISTDVTLDAVACAFIILICAQLDLLAERITASKAADSANFMKYCIEHHTLIFAMVSELQSCFMTVMLPSFINALAALCSSIFQLAQQSNTMFDYVSFLLFIACLIIQLYYFCWFGNELQLKNETVTNAIFTCEWLTMRPHERKSYWLMMFMGQKELAISYRGQCALNVQTFIWMLKTTYGAFNLLQQVSN